MSLNLLSPLHHVLLWKRFRTGSISFPFRQPTAVLTNPQPIPPSVKEILTAYATKGDGDRDVLLAILHAKAAEDQVRSPSHIAFPCHRMHAQAWMDSASPQ